MRESCIDNQIGVAGNFDLVEKGLCKRNVQISTDHHSCSNLYNIVMSGTEIPDNLLENTVVCCIGFNKEEIDEVEKKLMDVKQVKVPEYNRLLSNDIPALNFANLESCIDFIQGMYEVANGSLFYELDKEDIFEMLESKSNGGKKIFVEEVAKCKIEDLQGSILYFWFAADEGMLYINQKMDDLMNKIRDKDASIFIVGSGSKRSDFQRLVYLR